MACSCCAFGDIGSTPTEPRRWSCLTTSRCSITNGARHSMLGQISPAAFERRASAVGMDAMENRQERGFPQRPAPLVLCRERRSDDEQQSTQRNRPLNRIRPTWGGMITPLSASRYLLRRRIRKMTRPARL
jgi:hypothetical protein